MWQNSVEGFKYGSTGNKYKMCRKQVYECAATQRQGDLNKFNNMIVIFSV
jgi:hypothetical protein